MTKKSSPVQRSEQLSALPTGVVTARVTAQRSARRSSTASNLFIGRWITEGETAGSAEIPPARILASDMYNWAPGGHFVMHPAYGRIEPLEVGGLEVIGYDSATGQYQTHFFDSQGNTATQTLSCRDGVWTWQGARTRCTGVFTDRGKTLTARHERRDDGKHWVPSMTVTIRKID